MSIYSMLTAFRLAARSLVAVRGFAAVVVVTLALGLTLCTTAIVVLSSYLLNDLPYPEADRLYWVRYGTPGQESPRDMEKLDWTSVNDVIEHPVAWDLDVFYVLGGDNVESVPGAWVTPGFVRGLGIQPVLGRGFDDESFGPGASNVALISDRLWVSRFGSDPNIVGRTFTAYVSDRPEEAEQFTIIGVMPRGFWHINSYTDVLTPLRAQTFPYMARLRRGVSARDAAARITSLVAGTGQVPSNWAVTLASAHDVHVQSVRPILRAVTGATALVLLVACANVACLLLVRATRRQKEMAVRAALGAGGGAIARMLLAEGTILGGAALGLALILTRITLDALAPAIQLQLGRSAPGGVLAIDLRAAALAAGIGVLAALMCALVPLAAALRTRLSGALQSGNRTMTEGGGAQRVRSVLIAAQVALTLTLVCGSALMLRSVWSLLRADLGFSADRVLNGSMTLRQNRYPDLRSRAALFERTATGLTSLAGVESVGLITSWPLQPSMAQPIERIGTTREAARAGIHAGIHAISDAYFATLQIQTVAGRSFTSADRHGSQAVAIVSASLARRLWPGGAIGQRLSVPQNQERGRPVPVEREVVGVVEDVRQGPADVDAADVYVPLLQTPTRFAFVLVRTAGEPMNWLTPLRSAMREIDPEIAFDRVRPLQVAVDETTARPRFLASLLGAFAIVAALLALVGVYGVIAYAVRQREREIAVRLAIGAAPSQVTRLFLRQGGVILLSGLALGLVGVVAAGRVIESQLVGVTPRDPIALAGAIGAFAIAGLLAVWWPSRRAGATDPAAALRSE